MTDQSPARNDWTTYPELLEKATRWRKDVAELKNQPPTPDTTWYGHDILSSLWHMQALIEQLPDSFLQVFQDGHIADIGAADGDLAYFLESCGLTADIIDWPATNWNGLAGARALGSRLKSGGVSIHEVNLDQQFKLPRDHYDLVFFLGILYHLKNPYYVLEALASSARYCFLSTRIARYTADRSLKLERAPVAYLLGPDECNNDATNYWIFSAPGLLKLLERTGWNVLAMKRVGDTKRSNPSDSAHDERIFLALESKHR